MPKARLTLLFVFFLNIVRGTMLPLNFTDSQTYKDSRTGSQDEPICCQISPLPEKIFAT